MTEQEQIAAFIAARGVTRVAEGEHTMGWREMRAAVRGEKTDADRISERHTVISNNREYVRNGLGEWIVIGGIVSRGG